MLLQLGVDSRFVYDENFEQYLLDETRIFYQVCLYFLFTFSYNFLILILHSLNCAFFLMYKIFENLCFKLRQIMQINIAYPFNFEKCFALSRWCSNPLPPAFAASVLLPLEHKG